MATDRIDLSDERALASVITDTRRTRPRYFDGKFLTASDLMLEQSYLQARQSDLARTLGFGVVSGLRTSRASVSARALPNPAASVTISQGHGLAPSGEIVFLPRDLIVDLDDVPQLQRLNAAFGLSRSPQQPFINLSGLFVIGLRAVEFTANPTPVFPASVNGTNSLQDGQIIEATAVTLVPYSSDAAGRQPSSARAGAAREIFLEQKLPKLPASVLPLAMISLRNGTIEWIDQWLVRREAGDDDRFGFGFAPRALAEAHFLHYQERLPEIAINGGGLLAARDHFEILPPAGPLPSDAINRANFTQGFFPAEARVELGIVPEDELPLLLEESMDLPPIDLALKPEDNDALAFLVLAPVPRATFGDTATRLGSFKPPLRSVGTSRLAQQKPLDALIRLNTAFERKQQMENGTTVPEDAAEGVDATFAEAAWGEVLKQASQLWYVRRKNIPEETGLAGAALRITEGEAPPSGTELPPAEPPPEIGPVNGDVPTTDEEATVVESLAAEGLWGRYAFLRAVADIRAHLALLRLMRNPLVLRNPLLQQALFTSMEKAMKVISDSPMENFEQIQKDPGIRVLTEAIIAKTEKELVRRDVLEGLETVFKANPRVMTDKRMRSVLAHTNRLGTLAQMGREFRGNPELAKMAERIEKHASTGRGQSVSDTIDRTLKRLKK